MNDIEEEGCIRNACGGEDALSSAPHREAPGGARARSSKNSFRRRQAEEGRHRHAPNAELIQISLILIVENSHLLITIVRSAGYPQNGV